MKQMYSDELPRWMKWLGIWRVNTDSVDAHWGYFAPRFGFQFVLHRGGYFDQRYAITVALVWGVFHFYLPFKTRLSEGCNLPRYGIAIHNDTLWIYTGGKYDESIGQCTGNDQWISWYLPFFSYVFEGHWIQDKARNWTLVKDSYQFRKEKAYVEEHLFTYTLKNGKIQERTATCTIEKRKWHRKWFPFLTKTREVIDIEFSDEVGERSGSWKGGVIGMSHDLLPNESIAVCLERLERDKTL